jgi:hypothetical protein
MYSTIIKIENDKYVNAYELIPIHQNICRMLCYIFGLDNKLELYKKQKINFRNSLLAEIIDNFKGCLLVDEK